MRVLIAEDDALCRQMLAKLISSWGYEVLATADGAEALAVIESDHPPHIAILDWTMPHFSGIELCRRIKRNAHAPFIYIMIVTGKSARDDMIEGLESGADEFLPKPVDSAMLRTRLLVAERIVKHIPPKRWAVPRIEGYEVQHLLGKGSVGSVWKAIDQRNGQAVALKVVRRDLVSASELACFSNEILIVRSLSHSGIARIYDSQFDHEECYYTMELVDGWPLDQYVREHDPSLHDLISCMVKVCEAIGYAHQAGVVHRDLKPQNILVSHRGEPKIVDFGIARTSPGDRIAINDMKAAAAATATGTPLYMAPEQALAQDIRPDPRTDVYTLGVVLYVLLVRHHPCRIDRTNKWTILRSVAESRIRPPHLFRPDFDPDLERIILRALSFKRSGRYADGSELASALRCYIERDSIAAA